MPRGKLGRLGGPLESRWPAGFGGDRSGRKRPSGRSAEATSLTCGDGLSRAIDGVPRGRGPGQFPIKGRSPLDKRPSSLPGAARPALIIRAGPRVAARPLLGTPSGSHAAYGTNRRPGGGPIDAADTVEPPSVPGSRDRPAGPRGAGDRGAVAGLRVRGGSIGRCPDRQGGRVPAAEAGGRRGLVHPAQGAGDHGPGAHGPAQVEAGDGE